MNHDITVGWDQHLKNGNVWKVIVELGMQDTPEDDIITYDVVVYLIATSASLAHFIAATMYPDSEFIIVGDEPVGTSTRLYS